MAVSRNPLEKWFALQKWKPFPFQKEVWDAYLAGESGMIHATTGTGKTYAAWGGPLLEALQTQKKRGRQKTTTTRANTAPLRVLWLTPLKALAADTELALKAPVEALGLPWSIERRTGDTSAAVRARQSKRLPTALVTTPESLSLLLARADAPSLFTHLQCVIVDEWHELLGSKRGVQTELCLARLRRWCPNLRTWGLSATLGNLGQAMDVLLGPTSTVTDPEGSPPSPRRLVTGKAEKPLRIESVIPQAMDRFPWAGHLGIHLLANVLEELDASRSALVFTNTRSQTEIWYQAILRERPQWAGQMALHHGSLDQSVRQWVEQGLKQGSLRCVVCTSSLDLGVDFSPVERVLQIGSPKGAGRLLQRAGRSGHQPGALSQIICVPTHALELIEFVATSDAIRAAKIESRIPQQLALDVLAQHVVTVALGGGFRPDDLLAEVRQTHAYASLSQDEWNWVLDFVHRGGDALKAYPDYQRIEQHGDEFKVTNRQVARRHRMSIGTISSDASMSVQYLKGSRLGTVEESFIARLKPGDVFIFAGKLVELIRVHGMIAYVRPTKKKAGPVPRWAGGRMPLSSELAAAVRERLDAAQKGLFESPEMEAVRPTLEVQTKWSIIPTRNEWLVEHLKSREGHHLFVFPFEGRLVHEGLANLFAYRLSRRQPISFSLAANDYGFELLSDREAEFLVAVSEGLLTLEGLEEDITASLNATELAKRQFRDIARIAGLVFQGYPGETKSSKQLQASTGLLFDVFTEYDPQNRLLKQAYREVLEQQLESQRLRKTLQRLQQAELRMIEVPHPTPLAFPLLVDRLREKLSSESLEDRVRRMQIPLERAASR